MKKNNPIGKIAAIESCPTTITSFTFWTDENLKLSPFDIIKVKHVDDSFTFGQVEEISHITDAASFMSAFVSSDFGNTALESPTLRVGLNYIKARVLGNSKKIYIPVHNDAQVFFAEQAEIEDALGFDGVQNKVICGTTCMYSNIPDQKIEIPVPLNRDFLIGPEGAHLNISGISGLASKTSYAMFLIKSLTEALANASEHEVGTAAFIVLNVKGKDLLALDEPTTDKDEETTRANYEKIGLTGQPLKNVKFFYPFGGGSFGGKPKVSTFLQSDKVEEQIKRGVAKIFKFEAESDLENIDLLFSNVDDPQQTMASIIDVIMMAKESGNSDIDTSSWSSLLKSIKNQTDKETKTTDNKGIVIQSWRRFYRFLNLQLNTSKAFEDGINSNNYECRLADEVLNIEPNDVFVIDVAKESEAMQAFVFGHIMREVMRLRNGEYDGSRDSEKAKPDRIVIVIDEMNKYCSKDIPKDSPILKQVLDITERGRSLGVVLFGAEQFRSAIHERVTGNCATKAYGRTNSVEAGKKDYGSLNAVQKDILMRMTQGEYIIENPILRAPIRITFPKPIYKQYK